MPVGRWYQTPSGYDSGSSPPPAAEDEDAPQPIGVPENYAIPGGAPPVTSTGAPIGAMERKAAAEHGRPVPTSRYMDGDEWIPANYPGDMLYQLQQQLVQAGLLTSNFTAGVYDPATREAYKNLLGLANASGQDANRTLAQLVSNAAAAPQLPAEPLITQTTDPTVLRQTFRKAVIDLTGEGWGREKINDMVAAYNQAEIARQKEAYDMQLAGESGNVVGMPSPADYIESQVMERDPEGVAGEQALDYLSDFMNMASGGEWRGF